MEQSWALQPRRRGGRPRVLALREVMHGFEQLPQTEGLLERALGPARLSNTQKIQRSGITVSGDGDDR